MRRLFVFVFFFSLAWLPTAAFAAPLPAPVKAAYDDFIVAYKAQDYKTALKHGKIAWQQAETLLGDDKTTGDLASNYGLLASKLGKYDAAITPLTRSAELAVLAKKNGSSIRAEREVELVEALVLGDRIPEATTRVENAIEYAQSHDLAQSVFTGELWVLKARLAHRKANIKAKHMRRRDGKARKNGVVETMQSRSADYAKTALKILDKHPDQVRPRFVALAHKFVGFSHERNKEWLEATLAYQKAMLVQKDYSNLSDASYATTVGRWLNARTYVERDGRSHVEIKRDRKRGQNNPSARLKELGICKCWPFENEGAIQAQAVKRVPPKMPSRATTSGFSIVKFDLDDDGAVINPRIVYSWPKKLYEKSSLRSLRQWKYEKKSDGDPQAQRKDLVSTITYRLQTRGGNPI